MNLVNFLNKMLFYIAMVFFTGCVAEDTEVNKGYSFPLLKGCKETLQNFFQSYVDDGLQYEVILFDKKVRAIPGLEGYVALNHESWDKFHTTAVVNTATSLCYPNEAISIADDERAAGRLYQKLGKNRLNDVPSYIMYDGEKVWIYAHSF